MDAREFARLMEDWEKKRALTVSQIYVIVFALLVVSFLFSAIGVLLINTLFGSGAVSILGASFVIIFSGEAVSAVLASMTVLLLVNRMRNANGKRQLDSGAIPDDEL